MRADQHHTAAALSCGRQPFQPFERHAIAQSGDVAEPRNRRLHRTDAGRREDASHQRIALRRIELRKTQRDVGLRDVSARTRKR